MSKILPCRQRNPATNKFNEVGYIKLDSVSNDNAALYFYGDIVSTTWSCWEAEDKCPQDIADFLAALDGFKTVDIYINSGGGSVHGGLAIYHQLKRYSGEKIVHVDALAASIASVIAMAGDKIIIPATAQLMIHKPISSMWWGNAEEYRREAEALDNCEKAIMAVYMQNAKSGVTEEQISSMIAKETWITGDEAAEYFNIEVEQASEIAACCKSSFFDRYNNLPEKYKQPPENNMREKMQTELELLCL